MSVADNISFKNFCQLCTKISEASHDKKVHVLQNYMESWKKKADELKKKVLDLDDGFYPVFRLLLPQLDRERGAYGVKEHTLAKIYIRILSLPKEGSDAMKLLEYRAPKSSGNEAVDFADVAYWILKRRCAEGGNLSIEEVNNHLDAIANKHAANEPRGVDSELISLLRETSAEEQKWLIRILLKEMKLGIGQNGILRGYHLDAKDLYDASNNLKKVAEVLKNPLIRLHEIEIELFSPFKPMLSEECDILKVDGYLKKSPYFYVETKLDGERFQLHMKEGNYKYFSRNGFEYTKNFGANRHEGALTPLIASRFRSNVKSCILDGEMMPWNTKIDMFATKAKNIDVKNLKETNVYKPCFCVFDILLYNDKVVTNQPLNFRLEILNDVVEPLKGVITLVERKRISSKEEIFESLNEAIDKREEGIVMKEFMSVYKPNVRKNGGWYKIKPEYSDGLTDTLDLLIIGGYFGSGRHKGNISHFLVGVAADSKDDSALFYSTARVGSGYSMDELSELQSKLQPYWNQTKIGELPPTIEWTKEKPDVWVEPQNSFILEIKAAEITSSNLFKTGYTLRFPRVEKVRYDKSWKDCMTEKEFKEKLKVASGKLASHHLLPLDPEDIIPKKKTLKSNTILGSQFKGIDTSKVECVSSMLNGKEICVFTGFGDVKKTEIEKKIVEFGGTVVQNLGKNTFCALAETDSTARIKNVVKFGSHDVIRTSWFFSQLQMENEILSEFKPEHFLAMSAKTEVLLSKSYDEFGDHYTQPSTKETISYPIAVARTKAKKIKLSIEDKYNMDVELFSKPSPYSLFRLCTAYFDRFPIIEDSNSGLLDVLEIFAVDFRFHGGTCVEHLCDEVTHVVLYSGDLSRLAEIRRRNRERNKKFHIVTEKWIQCSVAAEAVSNEDGL